MPPERVQGMAKANGTAARGHCVQTVIFSERRKENPHDLPNLGIRGVGGSDEGSG